jgi:nucleoside-diphosphate-sugar epimerase
MLAAAVKRSYHIPFGGRAELLLAEDVADLFLEATLAEAGGASVFNLGGNCRSVEQIIEAIETVRPAMRDRLTFSDEPLPFLPAFDETELQETLGPFSYTPLREGVRRTIELFESAAEADLVGPEMLGD